MVELVAKGMVTIMGALEIAAFSMRPTEAIGKIPILG